MNDAFLSIIASNIVPIVFVASLFIEIAPIKVNPLSALLELMFKPIRKDMGEMESRFNEKLENSDNEHKAQLQELKASICLLEAGREVNAESISNFIRDWELSRISTLKWEISEFSNTIDNGDIHKREEYLGIFERAKEFNNLCTKHDITDIAAEEDINNIRSHYNDNLHTNSQYF